MTLIDNPKFTKVFAMVNSPIVHGTIKFLGSPYLLDILDWDNVGIALYYSLLKLL